MYKYNIFVNYVVYIYVLYIYLRKPMAAGLIILDWKGVFEGWLLDLTVGVIWPEADTPICAFCGRFWIGMILLLNSVGRGDITACGVRRRGVSGSADTLWAI